MRYLLILSAGLIMMSGCSPATPPKSISKTSASLVSHPPNLTAEFIHSPSGLSIKAPGGWGFVPESQVDHVTAECRPSKATGDLPVILVQAAAVKTDLSLETFVSSYAQKIGKGVANPRIEKDEAIKGGVQGAEGYEITYTGKLKNQPIVGSLAILRSGKWFYVITRMCGQSEYQQLRPIFDEFLRGIKLRKS